MISWALLLLLSPQTCTAQKEAKLLPFTWPSEFGTKVDVGGNRMLVGAPLELSPTGGLLGAAYVYDRVAGAWTLTGVLGDAAGGVAAEPYFGSALSLDGDQAVVGAPGHSITSPGIQADQPAIQGSVHVFVKKPASWVLEAKIVTTESSLGLGYAVDIDGDSLIAGSPFSSFGGNATESGKAFIFARTPTEWKKQAVFQPPFKAGEDRFGYAVLLRDDMAFVGSPGNPMTSWLSSGSVFAYRRIGTQGVWNLEQKIVPDDSKPGDFFGCSLALHDDTLVVGARNSLDPVTTASGGAYVFKRQGASWMQEAKLVPQGRTLACNSGWSVALDQHMLAVGAPHGFGGDGGGVFLYSRFGKQWVEVLKISPFKGDSDGFGVNVALSGGSLVVGAPVDKTVAPFGGAAYAYRIKNESLPPAYYCTGKTVSGKAFGPCRPRIFAAGEPSISGAAAGDKHDIWALEVRPKVKGMLVYSTSGPAQLPFAGGTLCVKAPVTRTPLQSSTSYFKGTECHGYFKFDFSAWIKSGVDPALQAGSHVWFQYWYREPSFAAPNVGLTGAMTALICQ